MSLKVGTSVISPEARRFKVHAVGGCDSQGRPVIVLQRLDRRAREQKTVYRPLSEVEGWMEAILASAQAPTRADGSVLMTINCGFNRKSERGIEHKNVTGIKISGLCWETDCELIRQELMKHRPEGDGWAISGYALVGVHNAPRLKIPFMGLLPPEKTEAVMRGERVQITAEESGLFRAQMDLIHERERDRHRKALRQIREYARGTDAFLYKLADDALEGA